MRRFLIVFACLFFMASNLEAQKKARITGTIISTEDGQPLPYANVYVPSMTTGVSADGNGKYRLELELDSRKTLVIEYSNVGFEKEIRSLRISPGSRKKMDVELTLLEGTVIDITGKKKKIEDREGKGVTVKVSELKKLPSLTGNLESMVSTFALGASSGTGGELSSQYSVRGGNYDENLVYVNDFEVYRPFLVRSGQQEGLTFPNIDLIRDLSFSSGGFEAKFGDKLSSVLDIKYKRPDSLRGSFSGSLLGASVHLEGSVKKPKDKTGNQRLRYLFGARYKTTRYILGTLDVQGEYTPNFADIQGHVSYDLSETWQLGLIGNYSLSEYKLRPISQNTTLGLVNFALRFSVLYEGQEVDDFTNYMGGLSLSNINPDKNLYLKFLASAYRSEENERFDKIGFYSLGEIQANLGSGDFGELVSILGVGTQQQFARNYLTANVLNFQHKGGWELAKDTLNTGVRHFLQWGAGIKHEIIDDHLNEWERLDSAGYSLDYDPNQVNLQEVIKSDADLSSNRYSAFIQDSWTLKDTTKEINITAGVRANYWDLNKELIISPRVQFFYRPLNWSKDVSFKLATGLYAQPAFYRELRNRAGDINTDLKAQKSWHVVAGGTYDFKMYNKDFRIISELYYKKLWDLVSYDVDNVRVRYSGINDASGYAAGLDFRLNGEFVPGAESWINLGILTTRENIKDVQHLKREVGKPDEVLEVNSVPRPSDRLVTVNVFFQDYLPKNENFKMNVNIAFGTGLPFGIPGNNTVYRNTYRYNSYHRVDLGMSAQLWKGSWHKRKSSHPLRGFENVWASFEVFNLLQVQNAAGNTWIRTVLGNQFAIPNYLTGRRLNVRLKAEF